MASITTASNRRSLKPGKIAYRGVRPTVRLGYRRVRGGAAGTWLVRLHSTTGYTQHRLGTADDLHPADGEHVLSFEQAVKAASDWAIMVHDEIERTPKNYTVEQACQDYLANLEAEGRMAAAKTARYRINQLVIPTIGAKEC